MSGCSRERAVRCGRLTLDTLAGLPLPLPLPLLLPMPLPLPLILSLLLLLLHGGVDGVAGGASLPGLLLVLPPGIEPLVSALPAGLLLLLLAGVVVVVAFLAGVFRADGTGSGRQADSRMDSERGNGTGRAAGDGTLSGHGGVGSGGAGSLAGTARGNG